MYDAYARSNAFSLKECLSDGPTFGQNITDNFRPHKIALVGDIEKELLMMSVDKDIHIDVSQFL